MRRLPGQGIVYLPASPLLAVAGSLSRSRPPVARKVDLCLYLDSDRGSRPIKTRTAAAATDERRRQAVTCRGGDRRSRGRRRWSGGDVEWMEKGFKGALTLSLALWPALWHHLNSGWRPLSSSVSVSEVDFSKPCSFFLASREQASEHPHHSHSPLPLCGTKELRVREERAELRREKKEGGNGRGEWRS